MRVTHQRRILRIWLTLVQEGFKAAGWTLQEEGFDSVGHSLFYMKIPNLTTESPGTAISPMSTWNLLFVDLLFNVAPPFGSAPAHGSKDVTSPQAYPALI